MSELTPCNFCSLRRLRRDVEARGNYVELAPGSIGTVAYEVDAKGNRKWRAAFVEITKECAC